MGLRNNLVRKPFAMREVLAAALRVTAHTRTPG
jgi:hypothetical protein